jgi:hypothetical protein
MSATSPAAARGKKTRGSEEESVFSSGPRRVIAIGAGLLAIGLAIVAIGPSDEGMVLTLFAILALIYGVHSFGRLGPD